MRPALRVTTSTPPPRAIANPVQQDRTPATPEISISDYSVPSSPLEAHLQPDSGVRGRNRSRSSPGMLPGQLASQASLSLGRNSYSNDQLSPISPLRSTKDMHNVEDAQNSLARADLDTAPAAPSTQSSTGSRSRSRSRSSRSRSRSISSNGSPASSALRCDEPSCKSKKHFKNQTDLK